MHVRWDAVYFVSMSLEGYVFEQQHAFFPLLPWLTRLLAHTLLIPLGLVASPVSVHVVAGVIVTNVAFVLAAVVLYRLTLVIFRNRRFALVSALMFCLSPAGMFMSAMFVHFLPHLQGPSFDLTRSFARSYTESLFALLTFSGMYLLATKRFSFFPFPSSFHISISCSTTAFFPSPLFLTDHFSPRWRLASRP